MSTDVTPPREDLSAMPADFTLEVPAMTFGESKVPPTVVRYREEHTDTTVVLEVNVHYGQQTSTVVIALIEIPQVCSLKFPTCEHRSV
ncbi:hypothetical protein I549_4407 [Mycobacterium avium subsp. avium 2285 (R)]|nr:hypothetical protein I549_4407 [Mycobacterium avium subsp. avium 2285 (R)]